MSVEPLADGLRLVLPAAVLRREHLAAPPGGLPVGGRLGEVATV